MKPAVPLIHGHDFVPKIGEDYDVVGFDPRGIGESEYVFWELASCAFINWPPDLRRTASLEMPAMRSL